MRLSVVQEVDLHEPHYSHEIMLMVHRERAYRAESEAIINTGAIPDRLVGDISFAT